MTGLYQLAVAAIAEAMGVPADMIMSFSVARAESLLFPPRGTTPNLWTLPVAMVVTPTLYFTTWQIATIAICRGTFEHLTGRSSDPIANLLFSLKRLIPALGVILVVLFLGTAAASAAWFLFFIAYIAFAQAGAEPYIWPLLPAAFVVAYATWLATLLRQWVVVPAFVIERLGVLGSMRRSRDLTKGRRGKIFRIYILVLIASGLLSWIFGDFVATTVATAFSAVMVSVVYHRLRAEKEGVTMDDIEEELDPPEPVPAPPPPPRRPAVHVPARPAVAAAAATPHPLRQRAQTIMRAERD